ncbi:MAG: M23 family metallopeptidase [bacterium]|nr:M23 family metallopeptidase [bacterium]
MAKRHQRQLSILVIPDDGSRTLEFKLGYGLIRAVACGLVVLLILVMAGGFFYWEFRFWKDSAGRLEWDNRRLRSEVARVDELAQMVTRMKQWDQQLRTMLSPSMELPPTTYAVPLGAQTLAKISSSQLVTVSGADHRNVVPDIRWIPSIWPVTRSVGWVTRGFEPRRGVLKNRHMGIDIAAPEGTPVQAAADGRVVFAGYDERLGQMVAINHDGIYLTRYGHHATLLVSEGEEVRRGQHIALVGNSGNSSGPHLHYEVLKGGLAQDPGSYLP